MDTLPEAGIVTMSYFASKEGKLTISDEAKLQDAITNKFDDFVKLFTTVDSSKDAPFWKIREY